MSQAWSVLRAAAREKSGDTDSNNYITSDANALVLWNDMYARLQQTFPRIRILTATQTGLVTVASQFHVDTSLKTIRKILRLIQAASASGITGNQLEKIEPWEAFLSYEENNVPATPTKWAYVDLGTDTAGNVGFKRVYFYPLATAIKNYAMLAEVEAAAIVNDSDVPDLTEGEAYGLTSLLAARLAKSMGQPQDDVNDILREIPDTMSAALGIRQDKLSPRSRPSEAQA